MLTKIEKLFIRKFRDWLDLDRDSIRSLPFSFYYRGYDLYFRNRLRTLGQSEYKVLDIGRIGLPECR